MLHRKLNIVTLISFLFIFSAAIAEPDLSNTKSIVERNNSSILKPEIPLHSSIGSFVETYAENNGRFFEKIKVSKAGHFKTIEKIFLQNKIPIELKYLAVVESKMNTNAISGCGALGLWQFMPATGKIYGLRVTSSYDDRKHVWKSTVAAAKYLNYLYEMLGDWLLVIASYNSGPAPVLNAIKRSGSRNFWKLQSFLPKETRMHVKKFIATHYFFEGKGSRVTMGKEESEKYFILLDAFNASNEKKEKKETQPINNEKHSYLWVAITGNEKMIKLFSRK